MRNLISITLLIFVFTQFASAQELISPTAGPVANSKLIKRTRNDKTIDSTSFDPILRPFYHGIASGDPLEDKVIIWTRVTTDSSSVTGTWRIATDTGMTNIVDSGAFITDSSRDYTVKIDVDGLNSNTTYYYNFSALGRNSLIGRTKTAPAGTEEDHLRFAVVSCNNYEAGYYNAFARIADRNDLHGVIHLGDYIYEYERGGYGDTTLSKTGERAHDTVETVELAQYRERYSLYRLDKDLRRAHQQHPFINIWDDHESANDAYKDGAENHDPGTEGNWQVRLSMAKKAFYEWIPIRESSDTSIYRTLNYGNLVDLIMLDTRIEGREEQILSITDPNLYSPARTMLGTKQRDWFLSAIKNSTAKWKIIGNQVIFSEFNVAWAAQPPMTPEQTESLFLDIWDGYPAERHNIITYIDNENIDNIVFLTGDFHSTFAFDVADTVVNPITLGYTPVPNYNPATGFGSVAVEFATPSISSANFDENVGVPTATVLEAQINQPITQISPVSNPNPHMKYVDLDQHGYFILDIKDDSTQANWYFVDKINEESNNESFGDAFYTKNTENYLRQAPGESPEKANQDIPAPATPPASPTGIEDISKESDIIGVYPNPAVDFFTIQFALKNNEQVRITLTDMAGQVNQVLLDTTKEPGVYQLSVQTGSLHSGLYIIQVRTENGVSYRKLLVN